jgi:hypothetical protein
MKVFAWYIYSTSIENKHDLKHSYPIGNAKCEIFIIDTRMVY